MIPLANEIAQFAIAKTQLVQIDFAVMLADARRPAPIGDRRRTEARERSGIGELQPEFAIFDRLPVLARDELRIGKNVVDRRQRRDQESMLAREIERFGLGHAAQKRGDHALDPVVLLDRLASRQQHVAVRDPVLVASGLIAETLLVDVVHELAREDAERAAEEEDAGDEAVLGLPYQRHPNRPHLDAAGHPAGLIAADRRRQQRRLLREAEAFLRGDVNLLAEPGIEAIVISNQGGAGGVGASMEVRLRHAHADRRAILVAVENQDAARRHHDEVAVGVT